MANPRLRHLSLRVPWHDTAWDGRVCGRPSENSSCLVLRNINAERDDQIEDRNATTDWSELAADALPPCVRERAGFLRDSEFTTFVTHPYKQYSDAHANLKATPIKIPAFTAPAIPFRWLRRETAEELAALHGVDYSPELEEQADAVIPFESGWVQHGENQRALLDGFFAEAEPETSLCFFYAKRVPHTDQEGRVLVGAARLKHIGNAIEYLADGENQLGTLVWERMVQHSLRPGLSDGFLLPYHEALAFAEEDPAFDPASVIAFAPDDGWTQFSFGAEHVSHDVAISSLVACQQALERAAASLPGGRQHELSWINDRLGELWELRGPCPGLGAALQAFGVTLGTFVVREIAPLIGENENPWDLLEKAFGDPHAVKPGLQQHLGRSLREKWAALPEERKALLQLISRFDLTPAQAERYYQPSARKRAGIEVTDRALLENPYLLYELDRAQAEPIPVLVVDHGAFPATAVRDEHPLPAPSTLDDGLDVRRARALMINQLESQATLGHTLLSASGVARAVRDLPLDPPCPVDEDQLAVYGTHLEPFLFTKTLANGEPAFQLSRYVEAGEIIRRSVNGRVKEGAARHDLNVDWAAALDSVLGGPVSPDDPDRELETAARAEKAAALAELAASRFSVLVGPAGTGKTTLLKALCDQDAVEQGGILLLAPTGKARVRMSSALGRPSKTIAQFLLAIGRYDPATGVYRTSDMPPEDSFGTVVIDEASMLTEDQLAAVIDGVKAVSRLILVGDPRQLPPIGAGRPFVDIVRRLEPENVEALPIRVANGYAELTIPRRAKLLPNGSFLPADERADLAFAEWFSGRDPRPGTDELWSDISAHDGAVDATLTVVSWSDVSDLRETLLELLVEELDALSSADDARGFELLLGGQEFEGHVYFHRDKGAAKAAEAWQILAPVRGQAHGVREINRFIQRTFREERREWAQSRYRKIPRPMGPEEIIWGDKVLSVVNESFRKVWPKEGAERYVANGDIGVVVGQWKRKNMTSAPWKLEVELASQPGYVYEYRPGDFGDEGSPPLELAYALTVHKAQGSEFGRTFLVIPNPCRLLTRELLYTALTRQTEHVTLLYQGDSTDLKRYARPEFSETAVRLTNLFTDPDLVEVQPDTFLEKGLIHTTSQGLVVRSKSEVVIAELLHARRIDFAYERKHLAPDGSYRYPDFTIEDDASGRTVYWEHLGMLDDATYRKKWIRKKAWYAEHGILPATAENPNGGPAGVLVETWDEPGGGLDVPKITKVLDELSA